MTIEKKTDSPQLRLAKELLEENFRCGCPKNIEAITETLEVFAWDSRNWAREQKAKRAKLAVIRGGRTVCEQPGTSEVQS
jgi:hypothetical protein